LAPKNLGQFSTVLTKKNAVFGLVSVTVTALLTEPSDEIWILTYLLFSRAHPWAHENSRRTANKKLTKLYRPS